MRLQHSSRLIGQATIPQLLSCEEKFMLRQGQLIVTALDRTTIVYNKQSKRSFKQHDRKGTAAIQIISEKQWYSDRRSVWQNLLPISLASTDWSKTRLIQRRLASNSISHTTNIHETPLRYQTHWWQYWFRNDYYSLEHNTCIFCLII